MIGLYSSGPNKGCNGLQRQIRADQIGADKLIKVVILDTSHIHSNKLSIIDNFFNSELVFKVL
jgi:hypothetical protein